MRFFGLGEKPGPGQGHFRQPDGISAKADESVDFGAADYWLRRKAEGEEPVQC